MWGTTGRRCSDEIARLFRKPEAEALRTGLYATLHTTTFDPSTKGKQHGGLF